MSMDKSLQGCFLDIRNSRFGLTISIASSALLFSFVIIFSYLNQMLPSIGDIYSLIEKFFLAITFHTALTLPQLGFIYTFFIPASIFTRRLATLFLMRFVNPYFDVSISKESTKDPVDILNEKEKEKEKDKEKDFCLIEPGPNNAQNARLTPRGPSLSISEVERTINILYLISTIAFFLLFIITNVKRVYDSGSDAIVFKAWSKWFMAGGVCALATHTLCTPIDVVKTRIQTNPIKYSGIDDALRQILTDEGPKALVKGLEATAAGYFLHGAFKYSFYEVFKIILAPSPELAVLHPPLSVSAWAGFLAEIIAGTFLCPLEAIRIRAVADSTFPSSVWPALRLVYKNEGFYGLFKGFPSVLLKQIPYTVTQFVSYEYSISAVRFVFEVIAGPTASISATRVAFTSTISGLISGLCAAIISQPGDTILSKINLSTDIDHRAHHGPPGHLPVFTSSNTTRQTAPSGLGLQALLLDILQVAKSLGFKGLFLGLGARLIHVACMIGGQFLIYDSAKLFFGVLPASALSGPRAMAAMALEESKSHVNKRTL